MTLTAGKLLGHRVSVNGSAALNEVDLRTYLMENPMEDKGDLIIGDVLGVPLRLPAITVLGKNQYLRQYRDEFDDLTTGYTDIPYTDVGNFPTNRIAGRTTSNAGALEAIELDSTTMEFKGGKLAAKVGSDVYYYLESVNAQPNISEPGLELSAGTARFIALEKHGVDGRQYAWNVRIKILFHGDHQIGETRYVCAASAIYEAVVYTDFLSGNIPRIGNLKVVSTNGIVAKYNDGGSGFVYDQTFILRENDIAARLLVQDINTRIELTNNIELNAEILENIPLFAKYTVEVTNFFTELTT